MSFMVETPERVECLQQLPFLQTTGDPNITQMSIGAAVREVLVETNYFVEPRLSRSCTEVAPKLQRTPPKQRRSRRNAERMPKQRRSNVEATPKQRRSNAEATPKQRSNAEAPRK